MLSVTGVSSTTLSSAASSRTRGVMRPSSSPSTKAPWPPWRMRPGAAQSAAQLTRQPTVRSAPTACAISSSLRPFCSETIVPAAARRGARTARASALWWLLTARRTRERSPPSQSGVTAPPSARAHALALDGEPVAVDRFDVLSETVHQEHVVSGARQGCTGDAADRARPVHRDHGPLKYHRAREASNVSDRKRRGGLREAP